MLDVTALILEDHATLRRHFAMLDDAKGTEALAAVWAGLARMLDVHAECEETVFYPALLKKGADAEEETEDAIEDHNKIRDAVAEAGRHRVDTAAWWKAVGEARYENSDHLAEEEREALSDFRRHASDTMRADLALAWLSWRYDHDSGVTAKDKDPEDYIAEHS